jgi:predicted GNAT family acetyltransferase
MEVKRFSDPATWLEAATPLLGADEARHNLLYGLADTLIRTPGAYPAFHLWLAQEAGEPFAAALRTPPFNVVIAAPATEEALTALVAATLEDASPLPGVSGALPEAQAFADIWAARTGGTWTRRMAQGIYACDEVRAMPAATGSPRVAGPEDFPRVFPLVEDFAEEALIAAPVRDRERAETTTRARLEDDPTRGGFWVWEDEGRIVSVSGHGGRTPTGIRIGPVYTPPAHRARGYATALVHAQTSWLLANAVQRCFLYTDLANPTSNGVYRRIGYGQIAEAVEIAFEPG